MPFLSAPGGSPDSVEVDSITVTAAISAGFGGGGGGGVGNPMGGWHITREMDDGDGSFIDIAFKPEPQNCAEARYLLGQAIGRRNEYDTLKNIFANEHLDFALKLSAATAGVGAALGVGSSMLQVWNAAVTAANTARAAVTAAGGAVIGIGLASVYAVIYIDRDRWDAVVAEAQADKDRLCGTGST